MKLKTTMTRRRFLADTSLTVLVGATAAPRIARAQQAQWTYNLPETHPMNIRAREMAGAIKQETNGRFDLQIFPNSQLGSDADGLCFGVLGAMSGQSSPGHRLLRRDAQSGAVPQRTRCFLRSRAKRFEYAAGRGLRRLATIGVRCPKLLLRRAVFSVNRPPRCGIAALALPLRPYSRRDVTTPAARR
jgi:hypothetical protein